MTKQDRINLIMHTVDEINLAYGNEVVYVFGSETQRQRGNIAVKRTKEDIAKLC